MVRRPPRSTLFPTRRSSDLCQSRLKGTTMQIQLDDIRGSECLLASHVRASSTNSSSRGCRNRDRKSTRLNSSHVSISYAVFCLKKKKKTKQTSSLHSISLPH